MARNKLYLDKAKKHSACLSNEIFFKDGKQIKLSVIQARNKIQCLFSDEESKTRFRKKNVQLECRRGLYVESSRAEYTTEP